MPPRVTVVGSLNMDLVIKAPKLPEIGETVLHGEFATFPGGKGANQAVAASRLGARVAMVGRVGNDGFGRQLIDGLARDGVNTSHVRVDREAPTGVALITVDPRGRNTIVVASGANMRVGITDVEDASQLIADSDVLLLQLEVPTEAVTAAARLARTRGRRVILDPAPARPLPDDLYAQLDVINPNEVEARVLTGISIDDERAVARAAEYLLTRGCRVAVIKMGSRGAYLAGGDVRAMVSAIPVDAVDSTAAGDAFAGALAVALGEGRALDAAVRFANAAAAISVTRMGAQPSMPRRDEVEAFAQARRISI